jgi:hypothetical protein
MVESPDVGKRNHLTFGDGLLTSWSGRVLLQRKMRASAVAIGEIGGQDASLIGRSTRLDWSRVEPDARTDRSGWDG